jgi:hypothetical protein
VPPSPSPAGASPKSVRSASPAANPWRYARSHAFLGSTAVDVAQREEPPQPPRVRRMPCYDRVDALYGVTERLTGLESNLGWLCRCRAVQGRLAVNVLGAYVDCVGALVGEDGEHFRMRSGRPLKSASGRHAVLDNQLRAICWRPSSVVQRRASLLQISGADTSGLHRLHQDAHDIDCTRRRSRVEGSAPRGSDGAHARGREQLREQDVAENGLETVTGGCLVQVGHDPWHAF